MIMLYSYLSDWANPATPSRRNYRSSTGSVSLLTGIAHYRCANIVIIMIASLTNWHLVTTEHLPAMQPSKTWSVLKIASSKLTLIFCQPVTCPGTASNLAQWTGHACTQYYKRSVY